MKGIQAVTFFYNVIPNNAILKQTALKDMGNLLSPEQLSVFFVKEDVEYTVIRRGASSYNPVKEDVLEIIKDALDENNYIGELADVGILWERQHIMIRLPLPYDHREIEDNLNLNRNSLDMVSEFETLIVAPATTNESVINVYVEDYESKVYHHFTADNSNTEVEYHNGLLNYFVGELANNENVTKYISTLKNSRSFRNDVTYFEGNVLLPMQSQGVRYHSSLFMEKPFIQGDIMDSEAVINYVGHFFDNPDVLNAIEIENGLLFRVPNVGSVRYDNKGLVFYKKTTSDKPKYTNLAVALSAAYSFLEEDISLVPTELHLREYEIVNDQVNFYFDIGYNDFPFVMSEGIMKEYKLSKPYPIFIKVMDDEVIEYKRILRTVDESIPQDKILESSYLDALDMYVEEVGSKGQAITDTYLGYKWDVIDEPIELEWVVESNSSTYCFGLK